jgi:hypothetical protein
VDRERIVVVGACDCVEGSAGPFVALFAAEPKLHKKIGRDLLLDRRANLPTRDVVLPGRNARVQVGGINAIVDNREGPLVGRPGELIPSLDDGRSLPTASGFATPMVKVVPLEYRRVLEEQSRLRERASSPHLSVVQPVGAK